MTPHPTRRRFLAISAAALALPAQAATPVKWRGCALGAEVSLSIHAPRPLAQQAIATAREKLHEIEKLFSLYDPASVLSDLNRSGRLADAPDTFRELINICARMHTATNGVFDPTVQPLWQALARGEDARLSKAKIGWQHVDIRKSIRLAPGQEITLNGIAQGFATDLIRDAFTELGLTRALINIGEYAALGGPFRLGLSDAALGIFATRILTNRAIATSSPDAMQLSGRSHILHPALRHRPLWSTVSVEADRAVIADAASTAFALMTVADIKTCLARLPKGTRATLLSKAGLVQTIG